MRRSRWISYDVMSSALMPNGPGCYAIYIDGALMYVGQSLRVRHRLFHGHGINYTFGSHIRTPWGMFRSVTFKVKHGRMYGDWLMTEARLIRRLEPEFNRRGLRPRGRALEWQ